MSNTLFPGRGVKCEFEPLLRTDKKKDIKRNILLNIIHSLFDIENVEIKERGVLIVKVMMSKLKFKYGLKPAWLDNLKKWIRKGEIPQLNLSIKKSKGGGKTPSKLRQNGNKLNLNNRTLDEYIIEDVMRDDELMSDVPMLSSDGFLKHGVDTDRDSAK